MHLSTVKSIFNETVLSQPLVTAAYHDPSFCFSFRFSSLRDCTSTSSCFLQTRTLRGKKRNWENLRSHVQSRSERISGSCPDFGVWKQLDADVYQCDAKVLLTSLKFLFWPKPWSFFLIPAKELLTLNQTEIVAQCYQRVYCIVYWYAPMGHI